MPPKKRGRPRAAAKEEPPRKFFNVEAHRAPVIQRFDEDGEEYHLQEPTPEQLFSEVVQRIDFTKTLEEQEKTNTDTKTTKRGKNPLDLFRYANGELEQVISLLKLIQSKPPQVVKQNLGQPEIPLEKSATDNFLDLKRRQNALKDASSRLRSYAAFAKKRHEKIKERQNDVLTLRKDWRLGKLKKVTKHGEISNWFEIDYSFQSCGAAIPANVVVTQTPNDISIELPEQCVNRVLHFYTQNEENEEENEETRYCPNRQLLGSTTAKGIEEINILLDNAQFSLLYTDIFNNLAHEARSSSNPNLIAREQDVLIISNISDVLGIRIISGTTRGSTNNAADEKTNFHLNSTSQFDMSLFHIALFRLLALQYRQRYFTRFWRTHINDNGLVSQEHGDQAFRPVLILDCISRVFSHILFRKKVNQMLSKLTEAFGRSGYTKNKLFQKFGPHRRVEVHWIETDSPLISSVDVKMCEGCFVQISLNGAEASFEDSNMKFSNVSSLKEFLLLRFCKYILKQLKNEVLSQNHIMVSDAYSFMLPELLKKPGFYLEIKIQPDPKDPSFLKEVAILSSMNGKNVKSIPLSEIPGCSYRSKICYVLNHPSPDWYYILLQNIE